MQGAGFAGKPHFGGHGAAAAGLAEGAVSGDVLFACLAGRQTGGLFGGGQEAEVAEWMRLRGDCGRGRGLQREVVRHFHRNTINHPAGGESSMPDIAANGSKLIDGNALHRNWRDCVNAGCATPLMVLSTIRF